MFWISSFKRHEAEKVRALVSISDDEILLDLNSLFDRGQPTYRARIRFCKEDSTICLQ